ncbi:hypothetical protein KDA_75200 [Dictyobacter alpinus]|uniref:Uncharacterized protein n=1 Tax=Dictyobacter alpinus TaxID=2014873 RepID=A0A402BL35_9CHLR|nr:hypothetical protein KDA_75200 [Dictyobacter alpinus]
MGGPLPPETLPGWDTRGWVGLAGPKLPILFPISLDRGVRGRVFPRFTLTGWGASPKGFLWARGCKARKRHLVNPGGTEVPSTQHSLLSGGGNA